ncbi:MAG TPA: long-chain fatty acid--CoA ligase [Capsulimonadaceae bacterium]|jgi:long-chain acyl-CoA synthetase
MATDFNSTAKTLNDWFNTSASRFANHPALNVKTDEGWRTYTYFELQGLVDRFARGLLSVGIQKGERVALMSENRPEWVVADLALLAIGAVVVPIYPTLPPGQVGHILRDSGAVAIVVSDIKQLNKSQEACKECPALRLFISIDDASGKGSVLSFDTLLREGDININLVTALTDRRVSVQPSDIASLVYTSGTTGEPKGAILTHGNFIAAVQGAAEAFKLRLGEERFLSFLPLCHVYERVVSHFCLGIGANTFFTESIYKVHENMVDVHPTIMQSVPRLFEAIHDRVLDVVAKAPANKQKLFRWAIETGDRYSSLAFAGKFPSPLLALKRAIADKLVLSKLRDKLGGQVRAFISAGAALRDETAIFFNAIGVPVLQAYGMTETTAPISTNRLGKARVGTVGQAFKPVTIKIATDGEILVKGGNVMSGYWNNPVATAEIIDKEGWLHTGDIGSFDRDGYLTITDRKKDILVLPNGKNVAPQPIESKLKEAKIIQEIVLLEDAGGVSAIVVPDFIVLKAWAAANKIDAPELEDLVRLPQTRREVKRQIDALSGEFAEFEKVRKIALLDHPLSIEAGEITPTLKVKRKVVRERYGSLIS